MEFLHDYQKRMKYINSRQKEEKPNENKEEKYE